MERFELAVKAITRAGAALRASRVKNGDVQFKTGYKDLVTYWDKYTEQLLRDEILTNFVNQHRNYAVSIGCWDGDKPVFGLVLDVEREAMYWAKTNEGAWCNNTRLHVTQRTDLHDMLLTTPGVQYTFLDQNDWREQLIKLARTVRGVRCLGSVALELCEVASGEADLFVTLRSSPWDHNAARIILSEAGGAICTVTGASLSINEKSTVLAANSVENLNGVLSLLSD